MPAPKIFKNPSHQALFEKQGFLVIPSFLLEEEVKERSQLRDLLKKEIKKENIMPIQIVK